MNHPVNSAKLLGSAWLALGPRGQGNLSNKNLVNLINTPLTYTHQYVVTGKKLFYGHWTLLFLLGSEFLLHHISWLWRLIMPAALSGLMSFLPWVLFAAAVNTSMYIQSYTFASTYVPSSLFAYFRYFLDTEHWWREITNRPTRTPQLREMSVISCLKLQMTHSRRYA